MRLLTRTTAQISGRFDEGEYELDGGEWLQPLGQREFVGRSLRLSPSTMSLYRLLLVPRPRLASPFTNITNFMEGSIESEPLSQESQDFLEMCLN